MIVVGAIVTEIGLADVLAGSTQQLVGVIVLRVNLDLANG
jgi:hypothetical protein